ncbi:MAG: UTP--glucose-1-phosphate uridylyltransferase [Bacillota bacterium]
MNSVHKAIIPVAGLGTRLLPVTKSQPKEMLPVGRKPCVQHIVEELASANLHNILFITGANKQSIENHFDVDQRLRNLLQQAGKNKCLEDLEFEEMDLNFFYTRQKTAAGLGDAVSYGQGFVDDDPFILALGDAIIESNGDQPLIKRMTDLFTEKQPAFVIAVREVPREDVSKYGVIDFTKDGDGPMQVQDLVEKPVSHEAPSNFAIAARYVFSPEIFNFLDKTLPGKGGEIQLTDAMQMMLKHDYKAYAVPLSSNEVRYDIGTFDSYFRSFIHFALQDKEYGYSVKQYIQELMNDL